MMNILAWIILGVVAGAIAKALYPGRQGGGFLGTMILGIIGSFVGGILHTLITTGELALASGGFTFGGFIIAIIGAIITLFVYYKVTQKAA